jgi:Ca-activated chloride channel family protein
VIEALHFIRPWWLLGLIPAIAITAIWARQRAASSHWEASVAPELLAVLLEPSGRGRFRKTVWAVALSLALATLGLAGPSWERLPQPVQQKSDAMVIVLDLSLSMFVKDIAPSRLIRARQKITDVLRLREEGFTALVAYAGDAHAVAPLTDDTRTIQNLLAALSPEMMPVFGSNVGAAMGVANELFRNSGFRQGRILLVTDGVDELADVSNHRNPNFPISILGVGSAAGGNIPLDFANQPGEVLRSQQGNTIVARLDADRLGRVAGVAHGRYRSLGLSDDDIDYLLATPLPQDDETLDVDREFDAWADMGFWVCVALLPLALIGFRRGVLALMCLAVMPPPAQANLWDDLWARRDQQAYQALREGQPETAATLFEDPQWQATAQYRSEDYAGAAEGFASASSSTGMYNLGNALAQQGAFEPAIAAYSEVLQREPGHEDAAFNKALVEKLLEEQQSSQQDNQQQQQDQGGQNPEDSSSGSGSPEQSQDQQQQGQQPDQQSDPQNAESDESEAQDDQQGDPREDLAESRDEQKDALEQWLRRVPDDPGGLLRRKFRYETNQRLRSGDYRDQQTEKIW